MPAGQLDDVPSWCPGIFPGEISERTGVPPISQDVGTVLYVLDLARQEDRHLEGGKRLRDAAPVHPFTVCRRDMEHFRRERVHHPTVVLQGCAAKAVDELFGHRRFDRLTQQRHQRLTIIRYERIKVDKRLDTVRHPVGYSRYNHAAIRMSDEDDAAEFLGLDAARDITNVGF